MTEKGNPMAEHTAEPWHLYGSFDDGYVGVTSSEEQPGKRQLIARTAPPYNKLPQVERDANARRIVACVNACKAIDTGTLEKRGLGGLAGLSTLREDAATRADDAEALLAGLARRHEGYENAMGPCQCEWHEKTRAFLQARKDST